MRILIDDGHDVDIRDRVYQLPWYNDSTCFSFAAPDRQIYPEEINVIKRPSYVESLVIACDLKEYSFISRMKNLRQLYIYEGSNLFELSFLEQLVKLNQLCIFNSHVCSLDSLKRLIQRKRALLQNTPEKEKLKAQFKYEFDGICVYTDIYDSDGSELLMKDICRDDIRVNNHIISIGAKTRARYREMMEQILNGQKTEK